MGLFKTSQKINNTLQLEDDQFKNTQFYINYPHHCTAMFQDFNDLLRVKINDGIQQSMLQMSKKDDRIQNLFQMLSKQKSQYELKFKNNQQDNKIQITLLGVKYEEEYKKELQGLTRKYQLKLKQKQQKIVQRIETIHERNQFKVRRLQKQVQNSNLLVQELKGNIRDLKKNWIIQ